MRKALNFLYDSAAWLAALFLIGTLAMVLASIFGRMFAFNLRGTDAYAGYCMAASSFLALAHTLKRGEHIRVTLILQHMGAKTNRVMEIGCHAVAVFLGGALAWYSIRLMWQSYTFNDISQGNDATPLWIPQIGMALGATLLLVAFLDDLLVLLSGGELATAKPEAEPAHME